VLVLVVASGSRLEVVFDVVVFDFSPPRIPRFVVVVVFVDFSTFGLVFGTSTLVDRSIVVWLDCVSDCASAPNVVLPIARATMLVRTLLLTIFIIMLRREKRRWKISKGEGRFPLTLRAASVLRLTQARHAGK
jgi:hypothetical protein